MRSGPGLTPLKRRFLVVGSIGVIVLIAAVVAVRSGDAPSSRDQRASADPTAVSTVPGSSASDAHGAEHDHRCPSRGTQQQGQWICDVANAHLVSAWAFDAQPTDAQTQAAEDFIGRTKQSMRRFEDVRDARAAGYTFDDRAVWRENVEGTEIEPAVREEQAGAYIVHLVNPQNANDGVAADPARPDALMYATDRTTYVLVGAMYLAPAGTDGPQVGGPLTTWHYHTEGDVVCWDGAAPVAFARLQPGDERYRPSGGCERGAAQAKSPQMLHVWLGRTSLQDTFDSEMTTSEVAETVAAAG